MRNTVKQLETLLGDSPVVIYRLAIHDGGVIPVFVSQNIERLLGIGPEEITRFDQWVDRVHPEDLDAVVGLVRSATADGGFSAEYRLRHRDGTYRWIEDRNRVVYDEQGLPKGLVGACTDIGERKRLEEDLFLKEQRLAAFFNCAAAGFVVLDDQLRILQINDNLAALNGIPAAAFLGKTIEEILPHLAPMLVPVLRNVLETGKPVLNIELTGESLTNPGVKRHRTDSIFPIAGPNGAIHGVGAIVVETTAQKQAEAELRDSQARLQFALHASNIGQWDWDFETNQVHFSPEWKKQIGYEDDEVPNEFSEWASRLHPDEAEAVMKAANDYRADSRLGYDIEFRFRHKDGSYRWIHTRSLTSFDPDGKPNRAFGCHVDITDRRRAAESLSRANDELEARVRERTTALEQTNEDLLTAKLQADHANRAKSAFLSRMSHELRTPMNAILGFGQLLDLTRLDDSQRSSLKYITQAGQHLLNLINEVLDLSRVEAGSPGISLEPVLLSEALQECISLMKPFADERAIELVSEPTSAICAIADLQRLRQVVLNVLSNAIKYNTPNSKVAIRVIADSKEVATIEIEDEGVGMSEEMLARLFTPFDRLGAEASGEEGTGLGLCLSKVLIEAMGGSIEVRSEVGIGSLFRISLAKAKVPTLSKVERRAASVSSKPRVHVSKILVIEDNLMNTELLTCVFASRPEIELLTAMQGRLGLQLAADYKPDVILLDLHLPDMHGADVLAALRKTKELRDIPVIVISADAFENQIRRLIEAGAFCYLTKPFILSELTKAVDDALDLRQSRFVASAAAIA